MTLIVRGANVTFQLQVVIPLAYMAMKKYQIFYCIGSYFLKDKVGILYKAYFEVLLKVGKQSSDDDG